MRYYLREEIRNAQREMERIPDREVPLIEKQFPDWLVPETGGSSAAPAGEKIRAVMLNIAEGERRDAIAAYFLRHPAFSGANVFFLNEVDRTCAPDGECANSAQKLAETMHLNWLYANEYLRVDGAADEGGPDLNRGKGNAILSAFPMYDARTILLPDHFPRYAAEKREIGTRIATCCRIDVCGREVVLCCTHLENRTQPEVRKADMKRVLDFIEAAYPDRPVLLAADFNTNTVDGFLYQNFWDLMADHTAQKEHIAHVARYEPLLPYAESRGYDYRSCSVKDLPTRRLRGKNGDVLRMKLDWFFAKDLPVRDPAQVEMIFHAAALQGTDPQDAEREGLEMSDHDAVLTDAG